jgi:hypothetical protein
MPKAILSNKIYLDTTPELTKELVKALTYKIKKPPRPGLTHFSMYDIVKTYKIIGPKVIAIPSGRLDLIPKDYEIIDRRSVNEMPFPNPKSELRSEQLEVYNQVDGMCFINAMVGWGRRFAPLLGN